MAKRHKIPMNVPYGDLKPAQKEKILYGTPGEQYEIVPDTRFGGDGVKTYKTKYEGVLPTLSRRYRETDPGDTFIKKISQYVTEIPCPVCDGYRLKKEYLSIVVGGMHIGQVADLSVKEAIRFFDTLSSLGGQKQVIEPILKNIRERLEFLEGVGLSYISLSRRAQTLS